MHTHEYHDWKWEGPFAIEIWSFDMLSDNKSMEELYCAGKRQFRSDITKGQLINENFAGKMFFLNYFDGCMSKHLRVLCEGVY